MEIYLENFLFESTAFLSTKDNLLCHCPTEVRIILRGNLSFSCNMEAMTESKPKPYQNSCSKAFNSSKVSKYILEDF